MDDPAKNSIWNYLIPLHYLEQVSSILERRGVEVSLTSHYKDGYAINSCFKRGLFVISKFSASSDIFSNQK